MARTKRVQGIQDVRHVALDAHKRYGVFVGVNREGEVVLPARRVELIQIDGWVKKHLKPTDIVIIEASTNTWHLHDLIRPDVAEVRIANAGRVRVLGVGGVKTDSRDALHLARLSAANLLPEVWVPPAAIRELRMLVMHRQRLIKQRTMVKNRLSAVLQRHAIVPPAGAGQLFSIQNEGWWMSLKLGAMELLRVRQDWTLLRGVEPLIQQTEEALAALSRDARFASTARQLIQLPGISVLNAMTLIAAIGDISRFASSKQLVGYAGLGARVYLSGQTERYGGLSKCGRRDIRTVMIEAAWAAVNFHPYWQKRFESLCRRMPEQKAVAAIARHLLVAVWHVWTKGEADVHAIDKKVAMKFMKWGYAIRKAGRTGLTTGQFVRQQMDGLGLGQELDVLTFGTGKLRIPKAEPIAELSV